MTWRTWYDERARAVALAARVATTLSQMELARGRRTWLAWHSDRQYHLALLTNASSQMANLEEGCAWRTWRHYVEECEHKRELALRVWGD